MDPKLKPRYVALDRLEGDELALMAVQGQLEDLLEHQRSEAEHATTARARDARRQRLTLVLVAISVLIAAASLAVAIIK